MAKIVGAPELVLKEVQSLVQTIVPKAVCELQDYHHQIGCGALDHFGNVQEIKLRRAEWDDEIVTHKAKVLRSLIRTGGSTAG